MPAAVLDALIPLDLMHPEGVTSEEAGSSLFSGYRNFVLARTDASVATLYNAQSGLFRSTVALGGSPQQVAALDARIASFDVRGAFALTEPGHGSDIAGGLATTARRDGDEWVIDGAKRWIGGAGDADLLAVFARDVADDQVKAFLVPRGAAGVTLTRIEGKVSLRPMQNYTIALDGVRVAEGDRLQRVDSWRGCRAHPSGDAFGCLVDRHRAAGRGPRSRRPLRPRTRAVRAPDRRVPTHPGKARADARKPDRLAHPRDPALGPTGRGRVRRRELGAGEDADGRCSLARPSRWPGRFWAATASSSSTMPPDSSPTPKPFIRTRARTRSTPSSSVAP